MFEPLLATNLSKRYRILPFNLPGFGAAPLVGKTTLAGLAKATVNFARNNNAHIILAHSVASVIATVAAQQKDSTIKTILSLEGNITAEDAYFSGTAANYGNAKTFRISFLRKLDNLARTQPIFARYRAMVAEADPQALWELGTDAYHYSKEHVPGDELINAASVIYLCNRDNMTESSIEWLRQNDICEIQLEGASHWMSVEQPHLLAEKIQQGLNEFSTMFLG